MTGGVGGLFGGAVYFHTPPVNSSSLISPTQPIILPGFTQVEPPIGTSSGTSVHIDHEWPPSKLLLNPRSVGLSGFIPLVIYILGVLGT